MNEVDGGRKMVAIGVQKIGGLGRATSEFVSARLGLDGVQSEQKGLY
jgi:hypothetical protein